MNVKQASPKQVSAMVGRMVEHQSRFGKMSAEDAQWAFQNPKEWIELCLEAMKNRADAMHRIFENEYLRLISGSEKLVIDKCDGRRLIADANDVFNIIDPNFLNLKADEFGQSTPDILVDVFEPTKDGSFSNIFGSVSKDNNRLCLTQDQIIFFVQNHPNWLRADGHGTFFMFKSHNDFFVVYVSIYSDGTLSVYMRTLGYNDRWNTGNRHRFVVPQLAQIA